MGEEVTILWTEEKLGQLKRALAKAGKDGRESIVFEGHTIVVAYGRYLADWLESEFKARLEN